MNEQAEEWEDMSETQRSEIKARLMAACDTRTTATGYDAGPQCNLRIRLARASSPFDFDSQS